jgi:hypothetical protein
MVDLSKASGFPKPPGVAKPAGFAFDIDGADSLNEEDFARSLETSASSERLDSFDLKLKEMDDYRIAHELTAPAEESVPHEENLSTPASIVDGTPFVIAPEGDAEIFPEEEEDNSVEEETKETVEQKQVEAVPETTVTVQSPETIIATLVPTTSEIPPIVTVSIPQLATAKKEPMGWIIASLIFNGVSLAGIFIPIVPVFMIAFFGLVTGIIALARKNKPRPLAWVTTVIGGLITLVAVVAFVVVLAVGSVIVNITKSWHGITF